MDKLFKDKAHKFNEQLFNETMYYLKNLNEIDSNRLPNLKNTLSWNIDEILDYFKSFFTNDKLDKIDLQLKNWKVESKTINKIFDFQYLISSIENDVDLSYKLLDSYIHKFKEVFEDNKITISNFKYNKLKNEFNFWTTNELLKLKIEQKIENSLDLNWFSIDNEWKLVAPKFWKQYSKKDLYFVINELENNIWNINNDVLSDLAFNIWRTVWWIKFIYEYIYTNKNFWSTDGTLDGRPLVDWFAISILAACEDLWIKWNRDGWLRRYILNFIDEKQIEQKIEELNKEEI